MYSDVKHDEPSGSKLNLEAWPRVLGKWSRISDSLKSRMDSVVHLIESQPKKKESGYSTPHLIPGQSI